MSEAREILLPAAERDPTFPWLHDFAASRIGFQYPMRNAVAFGEQWTVATNGHVLIFAPNGHANAEINPEAQAALDKVLQRWPSGDVYPLDLALLKAACGAETEECAHCQGKPIACAECEGGFVDHECSCGDQHEMRCDKCDGTQLIACPECGVPDGGFNLPRIQMFGGAEFNVKLLRSVLRHFGNGPAKFIAQSNPRSLAPFAIVGDAWRVMVMPLEARHSFAADGSLNMPIQFVGDLGAGVSA